MPLSISISDSHDGGNIQFVRQEPNRNDPDNIIDVVLHIKPDIYTELEEIAHMQYFSFRVMINGLESGQTQRIRYVLENAHKVSYPEAWPGTTVCYTEHIDDVDSWKRNRDTFYTEGNLHWQHVHDKDGSFYFSYFPIYSYHRHLTLISKCSSRHAINQGAQVISLGQSLQGREIECIQMGTGKLTCWIIHRQHPGETMAEHYAEGLLTRLLGLDSKKAGASTDTAVKSALEKYTMYIVPCMCPDGAVLGHLRTNACGANLNREWATVKSSYEAPTMERSPEVYCVLKKMDETGVDMFLDVHGDEELPYNFTSGATLVPNWDERMMALHGAFTASYMRYNSDMQQKYGYPPPESADEVLKYMNVATNQVANRFNCLGVTLEMPFKDCRSNPDPDRGWSPARSRKLGASVLEVLLYVAPYLRTDDWKNLPPEDAYVPTTDDIPGWSEHGNDENVFQMLKKRFYSDVHEIRKPSGVPPPANVASKLK